MNKLLQLILISIFVLAMACSHQQNTSMDPLQQTDNPVDAMRLEKSSAELNQFNKNRRDLRTIKIRAGAADSVAMQKTSATNESEVIDKKQIRKIPAKPAVRRVKISGNNVPLRQGPGAQFKKMGTASKGQTFELLRIKNIAGGGKPWYFVQNDQKKKFFITALFASIVEVEKQEVNTPSTDNPIYKEVLQKKQKMSQRQIRTAFDPTPPLPKSLIKAKHITLNFEGTEVYDVITTFCELLQIDYLIEGNLKGKVTLQTFNEIPVRDLYVVLEQIIALHNITVIKSGIFYRFVPTKDSGKKPLDIFYGNDPLIPSQERMIIQIIPLKYMSVKSMKKILAPLLTQNSTFIDVPETKNIMLVEMAVNVKRILKVVEALDIDKLASSDIQLFKLQNADSETVVAELEEVFSSMGYAESLGNSLNFLSLSRMNSILVVNAFERILPSIEFWIKKLDQPISEGDSSTFVYYIQNGDATAMSGLLNEIFQSQNDASKQTANTGKVKKLYSNNTNKLKKLNAKDSKDKSASKQKKLPTVQTQGAIPDSFQGEIIIIPDPDTNSLVIRTNPRNYPSLLALIKKLDLFPQQVLIEVLIIDVTLDAETRAGLEWVLKGDVGGKTLIGGVTQTPSTSILGDAIGGATAGLLQPGGSLLINDPGELILRLQAFASDSKANILANPILVTSNNKAAGISIVDEIPVSSTTLTSVGSASPVTQSNIEYRSVGIKLNIFPKINSDNYVNLQIDQEVSSVGPLVPTGGSLTPSFRTEQLHTEVVLKDNQVLVMGGLMRTDTTITNEGIPILKDIPWIGKLFGTDIETSKKTELMIFITPHIISNDKDSDSVTKQFQRRLGSFKTELDQT